MKSVEEALQIWESRGGKYGKLYKSYPLCVLKAVIKFKCIRFALAGDRDDALDALNYIAAYTAREEKVDIRTAHMRLLSKRGEFAWLYWLLLRALGDV